MPFKCCKCGKRYLEKPNFAEFVNGGNSSKPVCDDCHSLKKKENTTP